jgi:outer membrane receptor protein involved in Fe transport
LQREKTKDVLKQIFYALVCCFLSLIATAQNGKLVGKVFNSKNQPMAGASVIAKDTKFATQADVDGNFVLTLPANKQYDILVSYTGYETKTLPNVAVVAGQETNLDVALEFKANLAGVTVRSTAKKLETVNALIQYQKNTNTVAQVMSAEVIKRSPDRTTGEVLKRVPGTSVQDGKYLVVRGLSDRYNQAMLNGMLLSSTEPDRKTFSFDIFPAAMVDNIIINKAFVPELPGEWAGGLIQVNTKEIPSSNFFQMQIGTGFNSQTIGNDFVRYEGGKYDAFGLDDAKRGLPGTSFPVKSAFNQMQPGDKTQYGKGFNNIWSTYNVAAPLNFSAQMSGGLNTTIFGKKVGFIAAVTYSKGNRRVNYTNKFYSINGAQADVNFDFNNNKYSEDVLVGGLANLSIQLNANNKIGIKTLLNINASDYSILRTGSDFESDPVLGESIKASELAFKSNIYSNTQLIGEHNFAKAGMRLKWYGGFGLLDQYIPDQRRLQYNQSRATPGAPYLALISNTLSQKSGSRFFSNLSDYIYTAGGDLSKTFDLFGEKQTIKGGYLFQVKDRLFDARPFSYFLERDNPTLRALDETKIFALENIGPGKFQFDEISGNRFRYVANSILNAGYLQFDNSFKDFRLVWGVRFENFDQVVGSMRRSDDRHVATEVLDVLPGLNLTYKLNEKTNIRLSASQTVIRPEFREIASFAFFDFELGATITGNPNLKRTKVTNVDLRYELYPRAGELFTVGAFYKYFQDPIELYFNQSGVGTSNTFNYLNASQAIGYGIELEFRKKLDMVTALKNFTVYGNVSYIQNKVEDATIRLDRPMQGQSPYVLNLGVQYDVEKLGLNTTILFNQIGRRILYVGNDQVPAIWENPRALLDFQVAKKLLKNKAEIRFSIADILNQTAYFYHDLDVDAAFKNNKDAVAIAKTFGTTFGFAFAYNF